MEWNEVYEPLASDSTASRSAIRRLGVAMTDTMTKTQAWWQIVINDPEHLAGSSFERLARCVLAAVPADAVAMMGISGTSEFTRSPDDRAILSVDEFLSRLKRVVQFDWGDFFFCATHDDAAAIPLKEPYRVSL